MGVEEEMEEVGMVLLLLNEIQKGSEKSKMSFLIFCVIGYIIEFYLLMWIIKENKKTMYFLWLDKIQKRRKESVKCSRVGIFSKRMK